MLSMLIDLGLKMFEESQVGCTATGVEDTLCIYSTFQYILYLGCSLVLSCFDVFGCFTCLKLFANWFNTVTDVHGSIVSRIAQPIKGLGHRFQWNQRKRNNFDLALTNSCKSGVASFSL